MQPFLYLLLSACLIGALPSVRAHETADSSKLLPPWRKKDVPSPQDISLIKKDSKTFDVSVGTTLFVQNKYGEVMLHTWDKSQVKIEVTITAYGKTDDLAEQTLDRVTIDFAQGGGRVAAATVFDRPSSSLREIWNTITDQTNILLNRSRIEVDYDIFLPAGMSIDLDNKFGDIFIDDHTGNIKLKLAHGDMKAGMLTGGSQMNLNFANVTIKELKEANIDIKGGSMHIDEAGILEFNAGLTEVTVKKAQEIQIISRNDKFYLGELQHLAGKSFFSKIRIERLEMGMVLESSYGSVIVEEVASNFAEINVVSTATDVQLRLWQNASFEADITAQTQQLMLPSQMGLQSKAIDSKYVNKSGSVGVAGKGKLSINAKGGDVRIAYMDPPRR